MLKWNDKDINYSRGNREPLIVKFDNSRYWLSFAANTTTQSFRTIVAEMAKKYGASVIDIKPMYSEGSQSELLVVDFLHHDEEYIFRIEKDVEDGQRREFLKFNETDIFIIK